MCVCFTQNSGSNTICCFRLLFTSLRAILNWCWQMWTCWWDLKMTDLWVFIPFVLFIPFWVWFCLIKSLKTRGLKFDAHFLFHISSPPLAGPGRGREKKSPGRTRQTNGKTERSDLVSRISWNDRENMETFLKIKHEAMPATSEQETTTSFPEILSLTKWKGIVLYARLAITDPVYFIWSQSKRCLVRLKKQWLRFFRCSLSRAPSWL